MTDELRTPSSPPDDEPRGGAWESPTFETDADPDWEPESQSMYDPPEERHLGREIPLWAIGAIALVIVAIVALAFSVIGGGGKPEGTPTPDPTALARLEALAATPTPVPPTPTPTLTPTPEPKLAVGRKAVVTGSEPEGLLLRGGPGLESAARVILRDGTLLELLPQPGDVTGEYPVEMDGYTWWRVRVLSGPDEGLSGWVAADWLEPVMEDATPASSSQ